MLLISDSVMSVPRPKTLLEITIGVMTLATLKLVNSEKPGELEGELFKTILPMLSQLLCRWMLINPDSVIMRKILLVMTKWSKNLMRLLPQWILLLVTLVLLQLHQKKETLLLLLLLQ